MQSCEYLRHSGLFTWEMIWSGFWKYFFFKLAEFVLPFLSKDFWKLSENIFTHLFILYNNENKYLIILIIRPPSILYLYILWFKQDKISKF